MRSALRKILRYAVHVSEPEKVILFGSFATGRATLHSDLDLLIIRKQIYMRKQMEREIASFAKDYSLRTDILIRTPEEVEKASENTSSFLGSIIKQGKIIYKEGEFFETF